MSIEDNENANASFLQDQKSLLNKSNNITNSKKLVDQMLYIGEDYQFDTAELEPDREEINVKDF